MYTELGSLRKNKRCISSVGRDKLYSLYLLRGWRDISIINGEGRGIDRGGRSMRNTE
jgi:hypothetical protein